MYLDQEPKKEQDNLLLVENEYWVGLNNDLEGLKTDPRFQRLILESYFKDRAVNATSMLTHPAVMAEGKRAELMEEMVAISNLERYFLMINNLGTIPEETEEEEE